MTNNFFDRFNPFGKEDKSQSADEPIAPVVEEKAIPTNFDRPEPASEVTDRDTAEPETSPVPDNRPDAPTERSQPAQNSSTRLDSWVKSVTGTVAGVGETVANTGSAIAQSAMNVGETLVKVSTSVTDTAVGVGKATANTGSAISQSAVNVGETLVKVPTEMGVTVAKSVTDTIATTGNTIANSAATVGKNLGKVSKEIGSTFNLVRRNPLLQKLTKSFKLDALLSVLAAVDIAQAEADVRALQQQYPDEKPDEIAHRIILSKTLLVAGSGLASSLVPGAALALAGVDLATTTMLSAELVYQVAAAYGKDLQSIDRQGEALAILGLSTGGNFAIQAGINLVGTIPVAGAVINASASAAMMYALGYGACRFYEANLNAETSEANLEVFEEILQTEAEEYLEQAIAQKKGMDWILAHMVLAGNPEKTWEALLPELQAAHFSPDSLAEISANIQHPPSVEMLLEQIDRDFAIVLLERCHTIANLDGKITPEEARILDLISQKTQQKIQEAEVEQNSPVPTPDETFVSPTTRKSLGTVLLGTFKDILTRETEFDRQELGYLVERVDLMSGEQFEEFLAECFQRLGYDVKTTPKTNDFGADLILTKDDRKTVVQAKRYKSKVGNSAVQEVVAAIQYYGANEAIVVTNSQFTTNARGLAKANNVQLWEREQLIDLILRAQHSSLKEDVGKA
jgi:HJR/Mrr/RecB family endonuclease/uncharacterized protein (DUF697 family)